MPQPIRKPDGVTFPINAVFQRPELAPRIALIASAWSHVDYTLGLLLSTMLGASASKAIPMFLAIISETARKAALLEVARATLLPDLLPDFEGLLKKMRTPQRQRNEVVHGLWGVSDDYPKALIKGDEKFKLIRDADYQTAKRTKGWMAYALKEMYDKEHLLAYKKKDFIDIERGIGEFYVDVKVMILRVSAYLTPMPVPPLLSEVLLHGLSRTGDPEAVADAPADNQPPVE